MELRPPKLNPSLGALSLWAVYATEVNPPSDKDAVEWMLFTTLEVNDFEQALEKIEWYKKRWGIEEYHRTLKSGCRIENRQLGDRTVWENCLAIDLVVAWRIEHIKRLSRQKPQAPCTVAFEEHEWQALLAYKRPDQPLPSTPPSVREITRLTAELGGFLGRKGDGEPGSTTLARGLQRLRDIATGFLIFKQSSFSTTAHPVKAPVSQPGGLRVKISASRGRKEVGVERSAAVERLERFEHKGKKNSHAPTSGEINSQGEWRKPGVKGQSCKQLA